MRYCRNCTKINNCQELMLHNFDYIINCENNRGVLVLENIELKQQIILLEKELEKLNKELAKLRSDYV